MLPWALLFQLAAQKLFWPPKVFWSATPKELDLALGLCGRITLLDRNELTTLMKQHPDDIETAG
ncbi:phage tail assembly chaperone [Roseibium sp.]|uniref:phage tail assembly chaperone n=1 Tax=Roseibium sp. TaxID=1936156 RepID=UPI003B522409